MRYAVERIRYAGTPPRYADASFRYAGGRFRYAAGGFRVKFASPRADATDMLVHRPPMTNTERQRQFRKANPGYYARLHARRRAGMRARAAEVCIAALATAARREPLLLPAPVEALEIPGMTIPAVGAFAKMPKLSPVPVSSEMTSPPLAARRG
jgi:hypothetical protein